MESASQDPRFWNELYWFLVISLFAGMLAALVLPDRFIGALSLLGHERKLDREIQGLAHKKVVLEKAIEAMENDPIYQDGIYRKRIRVKRPSEEYIEPAPALFR